jgi:predicted Zn-dependent protease
MNTFKSLYIGFFCLFLLSFFNPRAGAISIIEEKKLADEFMTTLKKRHKLIEDPIVTHMVKQVGKHLLEHIKNQPFDFSFFVVNDDVFNAFAGPGANIFFYRGLITSLDSIDEFAGIVGHEIAHSASRHVSESIDRSKYVNIGSLAGVLAGAIIGSQSSDPEAGATIIKSSIALGTTAMLAFTRENETEADEKGIMFLKNSCFSPQGLLDGLKKIRAADFKGIETIPEYVKTHPGTGNRIAHVESILAGYTVPPDKPTCPEDFNFDMVKYRLLGRYGELDPTFKKLTALIDERVNDAPIHYCLGFLYERKFMPEQAMSHFKKALAIKIFDPLILLEIGRLHNTNGSYQTALQVLGGLESDPVIGVMARFEQASAHFELGALEQAKTRFEFVINKAAKAYPQAYLKLANIYSLEKKPGLSAYNLGVYYSETGNIKTAAVHFKLAINTLNDEQKKTDARDRLDALEKELRKEKQNNRQ